MPLFLSIRCFKVPKSLSTHEMKVQESVMIEDFKKLSKTRLIKHKEVKISENNGALGAGEELQGLHNSPHQVLKFSFDHITVLLKKQVWFSGIHKIKFTSYNSTPSNTTVSQGIFFRYFLSLLLLSLPLVPIDTPLHLLRAALPNLCSTSCSLVLKAFLFHIHISKSLLLFQDE